MIFVVSDSLGGDVSQRLISLLFVVASPQSRESQPSRLIESINELLFLELNWDFLLTLVFCLERVSRPEEQKMTKKGKKSDTFESESERKPWVGV